MSCDLYALNFGKKIADIAVVKTNKFGKGLTAYLKLSLGVDQNNM